VKHISFTAVFLALAAPISGPFAQELRFAEKHAFFHSKNVFYLKFISLLIFRHKVK